MRESHLKHPSRFNHSSPSPRQHITREPYDAHKSSDDIWYLNEKDGKSEMYRR